MKSTVLVSILVLALSAAAFLRPQPGGSHLVLTAARSGAAAEAGRSRRLCRLLGKLAPEVQRTTSVRARAQLVASIGAVFGDDPTVLGQLATEIDEAAIEHCPRERNELLYVLQLTSLKEAVR